MAKSHTPVMLEEVLASLGVRPGETALDCTAGRGGHAVALARELGAAGTIVINDLDEENLESTQQALRSLPEGPTVVAIHGNFADAPSRLRRDGLCCSAVLADLGFASSQIASPERGFSFRSDGPLDMRFDTTRGRTAADLVNSMSEAEMGRIIRDYGEERAWRRVAANVVASRQSGPIETTAALANIVRRAVGRRSSADTIDPATRTFQALRIAVNDELGNLDALLSAVDRCASGRDSWLAPGARIGVISFHSLEDRPVKQCFGAITERGQAELVGGRYQTATEAEVARNPRARSARLRCIRLVGQGAAETG